jgi:hypothetical protein
MLVPLNKTCFYQIARETLETVDAIITSGEDIPELTIPEDGSGFGHRDIDDNRTEVEVNSMGGFFSRYTLTYKPNNDTELNRCIVLTREGDKIMLEKQDESINREESKIISSILRIGKLAIG